MFNAEQDLNNILSISSKVNTYWEEEFNSNKFTKNQIEELKNIPENEYEYYNAKQMGLIDYDLIFEINKRKELRNKILNRPTMYEAIPSFFDIKRIEEYDEVNSTQSEDRFTLIGMSKIDKILFTVYCEKYENHIRIISVREATKEEVVRYGKQF